MEHRGRQLEVPLLPLLRRLLTRRRVVGLLLLLLLLLSQLVFSLVGQLDLHWRQSFGSYEKFRFATSRRLPRFNHSRLGSIDPGCGFAKSGSARTKVDPSPGAELAVRVPP